ncbi:hypothetical protein BDD41_3450 [Paracoccus versutus]|uniref:Uncharacterized protein n=1 Tax=Paracoccus versutus TaxID=34007 RepID=A0A3D9XCX6_PARVE|nr:hypothetical protein BDD41_3450 [Paracoccus versutus]
MRVCASPVAWSGSGDCRRCSQTPPAPASPSPARTASASRREARRRRLVPGCARLQERILAGALMVDQAQACELLGLSAANPSATMKRKEDKREILRFTADGRAAYPLFQFDVEGRRIHPAMARLIALKPRTWSDFRLLHWLTRPRLDFGAVLAERLGVEADAVIAAFEREIVPAEHG